jgi:hypothetical protein
VLISDSKGTLCARSIYPDHVENCEYQTQIDDDLRERLFVSARKSTTPRIRFVQFGIATGLASEQNVGRKRLGYTLGLIHIVAITFDTLTAGLHTILIEVIVLIFL